MDWGQPWVREASTLHKEPQATKDAESGRNGLPHGTAHPLVIQYQMLSPEDVHTSNIIHTDHVLLLTYVHKDTYIYETAINERTGSGFLRANRSISEGV